MHGSGPKVVAGRPLDKAYTDENLPLLTKGVANMQRCIEIPQAVRRTGGGGGQSLHL